MIITNGTPVSAPLTAGYDDRNTFPTHFAKLGQGGFEVRDSLADIKTISEDRREDKMCLSLLEKQFFIYNQTLNDWEIYPISGSGSADDWMKILGVTITPTLVSFNRPIYAPKVTTSPGTIEIGNIDVSGANSTLAVINTSDGTRSLMIGFTYKPDGSSSLKSFDLSEEEVHDRQLEFSDIQPSDDYTFQFTIPDDVIRTGLFLMPYEAGEIEIYSNDTNGKLVTDSEKFTFTQENIGKVIEIPLRNHVVYLTGQVGTFTLKGARVKGKVLDGSFIPYFKSKEYTIISRPEIVTEANMSIFHEESVKAIDTTVPIALPHDSYNLVVNFGAGTTTGVTQNLPDLTLVKSGAKVFLDNSSDSNITIAPYNPQQTIKGLLSIVLNKKDSLSFIADKTHNNWLVLSDYMAKAIPSDLVLDGGGPDSTTTRVIDSGGV